MFVVAIVRGFCQSMKTMHGRVIIGLLLFAIVQPAFAQTARVNTATVFVANYDDEGNFVGWGSGFFVDENMVVTNRHVIEGGDTYKVFVTGEDGALRTKCGTHITKSDVRISLEDDIAYMRVFVSCPHDTVRFAAKDPAIGSALTILGYPNRGTLVDSLKLNTSTGSVSGRTDGPWLATDALIHFGNSGGPVLAADGTVTGVAVAKKVGDAGEYEAGLFVPVSLIKRGLAYASDSSFFSNTNVVTETVERFGEEGNAFNPLREARYASPALCLAGLGEGAESAGSQGCRCRSGYKADKAKGLCVAAVKARAKKVESVRREPTAAKPVLRRMTNKERPLSSRAIRRAQPSFVPSPQ